MRRVAVALAVLTAVAAAGQLRVDRERAHARLSADGRAYLRLARDLQQRHRWGDHGLKQPFRWAPGAPVVFAATAALTGQPVGRASARHAQLALGLLLVPATFALAAMLAGRIAGLAAAAAVAVYVPLARAGAAAGTETLGALMVVLAAIAAVRAARAGPSAARDAALAGGALGLASLVRGDLVLAAVAVPVLLGGLAARDATVRRGVAVGAAALAGAAAFMGPWSAFASARTHRFVPVTDGGPANLFVGTDLPADGAIFGVKRQYAAATRRIHPAVRRMPTYRLPEELVLDAVAAGHGWPARDRSAALEAAARENLRRYALGRPVAFAELEARKLWRMWGSPYRGGHAPPSDPRVAWEHRALALLALGGLAVGLWRTRDRRLALLAAIVAVTTAVDVAFVSEARHNVRLMPLALAAGAAGWTLAFRAYRSSTASLGVEPETDGQPSEPQRTGSSSASRPADPAPTRG